MLKILIFYSRKFQLPERAVARFSGKTPSDNSIKPSLRKTNALEHTGFSLVEILMALLVASLLMTVLAPVIITNLPECNVCRYYKKEILLRVSRLKGFDRQGIQIVKAGPF